MNLDRRLLRAARLARGGVALTIGLGALAGVLLVWQAWLLSQVIDRVFLQSNTLADVSSALWLLLALAGLRAALIWGSEIAANGVAGRVKQALRQRLVAHLLNLGPSYAGGERSGELVNAVTQGVEELDAYFSRYLPQVALAAVVPLTIFVFVLPRDPLSAVILLLTAPLIPLFMVLIGNVANRLTRKQWFSLGRMSAHFLDVLQGLETLKMLGRSQEQGREIAAVSDQYRRATVGVLRVAFLSALVLELAATISTAVVAVQIGLRLLAGRMQFQHALFVLLLAPEFYLPLRQLGTSFHAGMAGVAAAQRLFEILDRRPPARGTLPAPSLPAALVFDGVTVSYQERERAALDNLSLEIHPGEKVALVGPSGAGKSTVAHLLLRFIEPDAGRILVGGRPLAECDPTAWRKNLSWLPQNPYLFHASVAENVRLARPDASAAEVQFAVRQAGAEEFIFRLPQGYDTLIGERGARLSGGQAQRLALARAFLKDAPLVLLDEASANLDPLQETRLQLALQELLADRTALIIAHRLNTVRQVDRILVLEAGRVVQFGRHDELLQQDGLYRRLVGAAASRPEGS